MHQKIQWTTFPFAELLYQFTEIKCQAANNVGGKWFKDLKTESGIGLADNFLNNKDWCLFKWAA